MDPLARITLELVTLLALESGLILFTQFTSDVVEIHKFLLDGRVHHPSSEVVGGEILHSPLWNLERRLALWTLDFPARA